MNDHDQAVPHVAARPMPSMLRCAAYACPTRDFLQVVHGPGTSNPDALRDLVKLDEDGVPYALKFDLIERQFSPEVKRPNGQPYALTVRHCGSHIHYAFKCGLPGQYTPPPKRKASKANRFRAFWKNDSGLPS